MITINRLRLEINAKEIPDPNIKFGFDIPFKKGLNIVAGHNSKGKSTICSCIYFALGMEELLGGQNDKALDKALKSEFNIVDLETGEIQEFKVLISKVFAEVSNSNGETVTIERWINAGPDDPEKNKSVTIFHDKFATISSETTQEYLYLRGSRNNESEYGFYNWLSAFIGLNLPTVISSTRRDGYSPLYLQTIFPAMFIEQTKGWSDFFATAPYFGIPKMKEKVVEFILKLNELEISTEKDRINRNKRNLEDKWSSVYNKLSLLAYELNGELKDVPAEITVTKDALLTSNLLIKESEDEPPLSIDRQIEAKTLELTSLERQPILLVGQNKEAVRLKFDSVSKDYYSFRLKFTDFDQNLGLQKEQITALQKHRETVQRELAAQKGIEKIFDRAVVKENVYNICPTCTQTVSVDLMSSNKIHVEKLSLEENIAYLEGQRKLIELSITSLENVVAEKNVVRKYFLKKQRDYEEEIKFLKQELIADDREYSESDALKRVRLEKAIEEYALAKKQFTQYISSFIELTSQYFSLLADENALTEGIQEDFNKLEKFENRYKDVYLYNFGYDSNLKRNISIQKQEPFRYFPVFKPYYNDDSQHQSIRTNSSASDFVRNIWAYSLSLLQEGENHPGIVLFDEPGQQRVDSHSLRALFESSAKLISKQVIIFTSVQRELSNDEKIDLTEVLINLKKDIDYFIYELDEVGKSIKPID